MGYYEERIDDFLKQNLDVEREKLSSKLYDFSLDMAKIIEKRTEELKNKAEILFLNFGFLFPPDEVKVFPNFSKTLELIYGWCYSWQFSGGRKNGYPFVVEIYLNGWQCQIIEWFLLSFDAAGIFSWNKSRFTYKSGGIVKFVINDRDRYDCDNDLGCGCGCSDRCKCECKRKDASYLVKETPNGVIIFQHDMEKKIVENGKVLKNTDVDVGADMYEDVNFSFRCKNGNMEWKEFYM